MAIEQSKLGFARDALEPTMSKQTFDFHYGKHHATYVKTANELIAGTKYDKMTLDELVVAAKEDGEKKLFNNAAQAWNHDFFWASLTPDYRKPPEALATAIDKSFGSLADFETAFVEKGAGHFGSGWVWLVAKDGKLSLEDTHDADTPLAHGKTAILVCDVWEHAYYLDAQNDRKGYLKNFISKLANFEHAAGLFAAA
ncbi:MAG: superoxide dismutase [Micropepsaceae bacterium]